MNVNLNLVSASPDSNGSPNLTLTLAVCCTGATSRCRSSPCSRHTGPFVFEECECMDVNASGFTWALVSECTGENECVGLSAMIGVGLCVSMCVCVCVCVCVGQLPHTHACTRSLIRYGSTIWSPLASGLLTGKYSGGKFPAGSRLAQVGVLSHTSCERPVLLMACV